MEGLKTTAERRAHWRKHYSEMKNARAWLVCDCIDDLDTALAELTRLRGLMGKARDALEPLSGDALNWAPETSDERLAFSNTDLTVGDIRRAARVHAALSSGEADKG